MKTRFKYKVLQVKFSALPISCDCRPQAASLPALVADKSPLTRGATSDAVSKRQRRPDGSHATTNGPSFTSAKKKKNADFFFCNKFQQKINVFFMLLQLCRETAELRV